MKSARLTRAALSALLILGGLSTVAAFPASASSAAAVSPSSSDARTGATAGKAASDGLMAAMQKDFGLTRQQAEARIAAEKAAGKLDPKVRGMAGGAFGGSWFDAGSGRLTVGITADAPAATRAAIEKAGADTATVPRSARELDTAKNRIDRLTAPAGVTGWHVEPKAGTVVVDVARADRSSAEVRDFVTKARATGPVTVRTVADRVRTYAAGTVGGDPYYTGNVRCSIGFSVLGGFVTAGHCSQAGPGVTGWDGSFIGNFQGSSFPDNDYAWVNVGSGWWTVPVVLGWGQVSDQLVRGSNVAPVGTSICRSGSTSHWHCGTVLAFNETVNYSQGAVHQMTKTSVCAEPGDSGGSFISGDQAQGVTSGGWGNCSSGGETWFQPINEILGRYGLTLQTA
ncbi:S1 family peptidase [Streptomyces sp. J2-1]|uniref:S1 family peptidase n=1 Tax=Streptomyces corallincola TaxID=2851888 RepID=UPI001C38780A|nr:S1 family peptidase [Streptomyces corallincola]MBV2354097.1 S1 family peptidase [Streptomyces corallincola]